MRLVYLILIFLASFDLANSSEFFKDISNQILNQGDRLSYGVAVSDTNNDGNYEFIVTGFGNKNLALSSANGKLINVAKSKVFTDREKLTIGVASCDIDGDGFEEIYFLNTDTYSGVKRYSDRLIDLKNNKYIDLFEQEVNKENLNLTAGRSVACVDRKGDGMYGFYVANYGGPTRFYEMSDKKIIDIASELGLDKITGGRSVVSGHILSNKIDIFAANERGSNFLYKNVDGIYFDMAASQRVLDTYQNGRGTVLSDILYRGNLDIINGNWDGYHRLFVKRENFFEDIATSPFNAPSKIRTVISADFDNDGFDEIFMNNIGEPNKLFKILNNGKVKEISIKTALEPNGLGTGAAVADIDNDGILELLISHGEVGLQKLTLYKANIDKKKNFIRIKPLNKNGAPARGATVTLISNKRKHAKTIDSGSGYLCQMEPVAHYGIRDKEEDFLVKIRWTNGEENTYKINEVGKTYTYTQK